MKLNSLLIIIICSFFIISCKNEDPKKNSKTNIYENNPVFNNFLFFKKGMTYEEVTNLLKTKKIKFTRVDPKNQFFKGQTPSKIWELKRTNVIYVNELQVLNEKIPVMIIFMNNKIVTISYYFEMELLDIELDNSDIEIIQKELKLLKSLSDALTEKYGNPQEKKGNLNAFEPTSKNDFTDSYAGNVTVQYSEYSKWLNNDGSTEIELYNQVYRKINQLNNKLLHFQMFSFINVYLDNNEIEKVRKLDNENSMKKNLRKKKINDSINKIKLKERKKQIEEL